MNQTKLTICIPSFNRLEKVKCCVSDLLDQIGESEITLQVIDNGSPQIYIEEFSRYQKFNHAIATGVLKIIRNPFNIGMAANFMRSFEVATGDWLWMVADDDKLHNDAVKSVIDAINNHSQESGLIVFGSVSKNSFQNISLLKNFEEFVDFNEGSHEVFNRFIFLTNSVYKLSQFKNLISVGYNYLGTYIPHFMMQVAYMQQGSNCVAIQKDIVDYIVPKVGYSYSMVAGLGVGSPKHTLVKTDPLHYKKYLSLFFPHNDYKVIIDLYYICMREADVNVCRHLAKNYLYYVADARNLFNMFSLRLFIYTLRSPVIFNLLIKFFCAMSSKVKLHVAEIRARYR